jgi:peptidoglycan/LPS O-acetylase OafA/YrhL
MSAASTTVNATDRTIESAGLATPKHLPALDGLRAVAILMVILTHVNQGWVAALSIYVNSWPEMPTFALRGSLRGIGAGAANGVQLFFVVSAFTLTIGMPRYGRRLVTYATRRLARVGPGYWVAGILYTLLAGMAPRMWAPDGVSPLDLLVAFLFGSVWRGEGPLAVVPGGWSVCCEVAFYVALPFALLVIDNRLWRAGLLAALAAAFAQWRYIHGLRGGSSGFYLFVSPTQQAAVFLCGIIAAIVYQRNILPPMRGPGILAMGLLLAAVLVLPLLPIPAWVLQGHLIFAVLVAGAVVLAAHDPPWLLANRAMRRIGEVSYSMYLVHFVILLPSLKLALWLVPAADWRTMLIHYAITTAAAFVIACFTYAVIERPAIRWAARQSSRWMVPAD